MNARVQRLWQDLEAFFSALPLRRRLIVAGTGIVSIALVLGLAWWVQRPLMKPLFTNLSQQDASAMVEALREEKVEYELDDGGRAILVPSERLYELRLSLASRGLPEGGGVGFEIFDRQSLGQTDFLQHLNFQRALQGELARTISQLGGVESARVHLALPERSLFVAQDRRPSASVVVKLAQGRTLGRAQIDGIVHLVAASVEGMDADGVTVVDESGRILSDERSQGLDVPGGSTEALEYQHAVERTAEERIETMLGTVVGREGVIARVAAQLDFARAERTEERYDPDGAVVKTQQATKEETIGAKTAGGAPGTQSNLTNDPIAVESPQGPTSHRKEEQQTFEISKIISRTIAPVGQVQQLSVAVLVDGTWKDENGTRTFVPRPQDELDRLKDLVKSAIGFNEERGDRVEVTSAPFQAVDTEAGGEGMLGAVGRWAPSILMRLLGIGFAAMALLYVVRPLLLSLAVRRSPIGPNGEVDMSDMAAAVGQLTTENLQLTQKNPERAAQLVREWLYEDADATTRSA